MRLPHFRGGLAFYLAGTLDSVQIKEVSGVLIKLINIKFSGVSL